MGYFQYSYVFFLSSSFLFFFSTGRTAGKQSNMFQHGLMIRYPIGKKYFPIISLLWLMDMMKLSVGLLERPLYLIIDSIRVCVLCYEFFFILCVS